MLAVAVLLAIGCGLAGLDASYQLSTASGATIAATILVVYLLALGRATLRRRSVPLAGPSGPAVR
jgi:ABC-type Mn2+/Zn2+ transport system permease subunit